MFKLNRMDVGATPPIEYLAVTANETYEVGEALKIASGAVTKCSGTTAPAYVCVGAESGGKLPCIKVQKYMEFATSFGVAPGEGVTIAVGDKVTIHTDGMTLTSTKTSGVAEITALDATAAVGVSALVRF